MDFIIDNQDFWFRGIPFTIRRRTALLTQENQGDIVQLWLGAKYPHEILAFGQRCIGHYQIRARGRCPSPTERSTPRRAHL